MRIDPTKTQKEAKYEVVLDILKLSPYYSTFLITIDVPEIYMQQFWFTISKVKDSSLYQFKLDNKKFRIGVELFREILHICPKVPSVEFLAPSHDAIVTFIKSLGYKGSLKNLPDLYTAQILWGMFYKKNVDFAELIWEDLQYQIDNRQTSARRCESIPYLRFTKVIIHHFLSKHKSISRRNGLFMNSIKHDAVLGRLKFVGKYEENKVYGMSIPDVMVNQEIKDSKAYHTYLAFSTGAVIPKKARKGTKENATPKKISYITADEDIIPDLEEARRRSTGVVIRDTPDVPKKNIPDQSLKLKDSSNKPVAQVKELVLHQRFLMCPKPNMQFKTWMWITGADVSLYGALLFNSSWFLVKSRHRYAVSSLMDTAYRGLDEEEIILTRDDERTKSEREVARREEFDEEKYVHIDDEHYDDEMHEDEELHTEDEARDDEYVHNEDEKHDANERMDDEKIN
ncbi:hypothetical protein Tco_0939023 [Tanacetum coccineum]|uniref:Uncharacterized protein n=1 Tax=Tanacetum coccineum TaxID=301880 RepID=A0ABQ5DJT9_9ASTR